MEKGIFWLASYPKSGNTWFRIFLKNLEADGEEPVSINDLSDDDSPIASARRWFDDIVGFDSADIYQWEIDSLRPTVYDWTASNSDEPSYHKIHDACWQLESGEWLIPRSATAGALYFVRNPLDVAISYANHCQSSIDKAIQRMGQSTHRFCKNKHRKLTHQTEQRLLSWSEHVLSWADNPEIDTHVLRYEDMKHRAYDTFSDAAAYLGLSTEPEKIHKALKFSDFKHIQGQEKTERFKEAPPNTQRFFRKGVAGDWKETLSSSQIDRIIHDHHAVMHRFGYLGADGHPKIM